MEGIAKKWVWIGRIIIFISLMMALYTIGNLHGVMNTAAELSKYEGVCALLDHYYEGNENAPEAYNTMRLEDGKCTIGENNTKIYSELRNTRIYSNESIKWRVKLRTALLMGMRWREYEN